MKTEFLMEILIYIFDFCGTAKILCDNVLQKKRSTSHHTIYPNGTSKQNVT